MLWSTPFGINLGIRHKLKTYLDVLAELLIEFLVVVGIFSQLTKEFHTLLDNVLPDDFQDFTLLKHLTRDVQWEIFRVYNTLDKVEVLGDDVLTVVHDEHSTYIQFDIVLLLLVLKEVKRCPFWYKEESTEFQLTFN